MTVTALPVRDEYTGTAGQTVFNYTFLIFTNLDLNVYITPAGQEANDSTDFTDAYTIDVGTIGNPVGGFITLSVGVSAGDLVTIVSSIVENRTTDYQNSGDFLPVTVNADFDRVVSIAKQIDDRSGRTLSFEESQQGAQGLTLSAPDPGLYVRWKSDSSGLENIDLASFGSPTTANLVSYTPTSPLTATDVQGALDELAVSESALAANRTYYVRTDGSDSNDGLNDSPGGAFLTIQKAVDVVTNTLNFNGYQVVISVGDGAYTDPVVVDGRHTGAGALYIIGNVTTPANCTVDTVSATCFLGKNGAVFGVRGFSVGTTTSGTGVQSQGASINTQSMDFRACVDNHYDCGLSGSILIDGDYSISGGTIGHWHVGTEGAIVVAAITVTVNGAYTYGAYFVGVAEGSVSCPNVTFTSTAGSGAFFLAHKNGTIEIGANNVSTYFPGSANGTTNTGGVIQSTDRAWTPVLSFATPGDLAITYSKQVGYWSRVGDITFYTCEIQTSSFTHTTASGAINITGLPFQSKNIADGSSTSSLVFTGITKASYTQFTPVLSVNSTLISIQTSGSGQAVSSVFAADMPTGGSVTLRFSITCLSATTE